MEGRDLRPGEQLAKRPRGAGHKQVSCAQGAPKGRGAQTGVAADLCGAQLSLCCVKACAWLLTPGVGWACFRVCAPCASAAASCSYCCGHAARHREAGHGGRPTDRWDALCPKSCIFCSSWCCGTGCVPCAYAHVRIGSAFTAASRRRSLPLTLAGCDSPCCSGFSGHYFAVLVGVNTATRIGQHALGFAGDGLRRTRRRSHAPRDFGCKVV